MKYDRNYPSHVREISSNASIFRNTKENSTEILISAMRRPWEFLFHPSSTLNTSFTLHCRKLVETSISRVNKAIISNIVVISLNSGLNVARGTIEFQALF